MSSFENLKKQAMDVWAEYEKIIQEKTGLNADINQTDIYNIIKEEDEERLLKFIIWFKKLINLIEEAEPPFLSVLQSKFV